MAEAGNIETGNTAGFRRPPERLIANPKSRLRDQFHEVCRFKHLSARTEEAYWGWVRRFLVFHKQGQEWRHPRELGAEQVQRFLTDLAARRQVAASTQNQALNALVFLYREVLLKPLEMGMEFERAKRPLRLPVVLTQEEVKGLLGALAPAVQLPVRVLYGSGLRLMECLRLRVKDIKV